MELMNIRRGLMAMASGNSNVKIASGYTTIDADTLIIEVTHNLGVTPNFAAIWADIDDYDDISGDTCFAASYILTNYANSSSHNNLYPMHFSYYYKPASTGNFLSGLYTMFDNQYSTTKFQFQRGGYNWAKLDANGNPIIYKWVVGYMKSNE